MSQEAWSRGSITTWSLDPTGCGPGVDRWGAQRRELVAIGSAPVDERQVGPPGVDLFSQHWLFEVLEGAAAGERRLAGSAVRQAGAAGHRLACVLAAPGLRGFVWFRWVLRLFMVIISVPPHVSSPERFIVVFVQLVVFVLLVWLM